MKLNKFLLVTALSLFAASGLMAKSQPKDEIPGVAAQSASYFYTGKPYDADLGAFTFKYRNYDPELKRWTSADPSGFPDGANNTSYAPCPTWKLDPNGLISITGQTTPNLQSYSTRIQGINYTISATTATQINGGSFGMSIAGYTFSAGNYSGSLEISNYSVNCNNGIGSVPINVSATGGTQDNHWIQLITTNAPLGGHSAGSPYFDNNNGSSPFYDSCYDAGSSYFYDCPSRPLTGATLSSSITWSAGLYYVNEAPGSGSVTVYGGFSYSWKITASE